MRNILEMHRMNSVNIEFNEKVAFDVPPIQSEGIIYDNANREVVLPEAGLYSVKWWVSTETSLTGCIQFALKSSEDEDNILIGASPIKRGQVAGFGAISATKKGVKLSLENVGSCPVMLPQQKDTPTAYFLVMRIPEDNVIQIYNRNLSVAGSFCNVEIGNVIYRVLRTGSMRITLLPLYNDKPVYVDVKRSSNYDDAGVQGRSYNNELLNREVEIDPDMLLNANEMHRTWVRQLNPEGTLCSLCEVDLFISMSGSRVSIWVNWIYRDVPTSEFV